MPRASTNRQTNPANLGPIVLAGVMIWLQAMGQFAQAYSHNNPVTRAGGDFVEYWAAARLLLDGENPYSPEEMLAMQRTVEPDRHQPLLMWNPPWTLTFTAPFGLLRFGTAHFLWLLLSIAFLITCSPYLWRIYGGNPDKSRIAWLVCFAVSPTYLVLWLKQITPFLLLGVVGFLYFVERKQWFVAGLSLCLVSIKPHLVFLFWLALLAWIVEERQWRIIFGVISGLIFATLVPLLLVPDIFSNYFQQYSTTQAPKPLDWETPTLSTALGLLIGINEYWFRGILPLATCVAFIFYWRKKRNRWNWVEQMPLLLLASQATTLFAWPFDQIMLLPALIEVAVWITDGGPGRIVRGIVVSFLLINLGPIIVILLAPNYFLLFWMTPLYLFAYALVKKQVSRNAGH